MQLGIDIDFYTFPGQNVAAAAATDVAYIKKLHANAVSVSFPFFMSGPASPRVYASTATPSPHQLGVLARAAERAHLYVSIRPLLAEGSLGSRVAWRPRDPAAWFASYRRFLLPYAVMAQRVRIAEVIVGTEFSRFGRSPYWRGLDGALRRVYTGSLAFANNWGHKAFTGRKHLPFAGIGGGRSVVEAVDAYPPMPPWWAGSLASFWHAVDAALPPGTVETEVGIDAVAGAFTAPFQHRWPAGVLDQAVQVDWFTAACHAAARTHLGGIYFWSIGLSQRIGHGPTPVSQGHWPGGLGAQAISRCFAALAAQASG